MNLIRQPNRYSCMTCAFAMALDISYDELVRRIGHDGGKPHFQTHRPVGMHLQECIDVALELGYACTPIELWPNGEVPPTPTCRHPDLYIVKYPRGNLQRFEYHLRNSRGIVECGQPSGKYHALAYDRMHLIDPDGQPFLYSSYEACEKQGYNIHTLWRIDKRCR